MSDAVHVPASVPSTLHVPAGADQFGKRRGIGIGTIEFKLTPPDGDGTFILEITLTEKGGPMRHFHYDQEEWFYVSEGEFILEVGAERFELHPGDSVLAPRKVPHVWAHIGGSLGRLLIVFPHAGKMEAFFLAITKGNAVAPQGDPEFWRQYDMEWVGPPLAL